MGVAARCPVLVISLTQSAGRKIVGVMLKKFRSSPLKSIIDVPDKQVTPLVDNEKYFERRLERPMVVTDRVGQKTQPCQCSISTRHKRDTPCWTRLSLHHTKVSVGTLLGILIMVAHSSDNLSTTLLLRMGRVVAMRAELLRGACTSDIKMPSKWPHLVLHLKGGIVCWSASFFSQQLMRTSRSAPTLHCFGAALASVPRVVSVMKQDDNSSRLSCMVACLLLLLTFHPNKSVIFVELPHVVHSSDQCGGRQGDLVAGGHSLRLCNGRIGHLKKG